MKSITLQRKTQSTLQYLNTMKNIFNDADKNELLQRVEKLTPLSQPLWGTMDVSQMLAHFSEACRIPVGQVKPQRVSFPLIALGFLLKSTVLGEKSFRRNTPTAAETTITGHRDFATEKANFINAIISLNKGGEQGIKATHHHFLGKLTANQWGRMVYKHADHHLSQFGV